MKKLTASVISVLLMCQNAMALPQQGVVTNGNATINTNGNTMNINQTSQRADIDWRTFDINTNELVKFNQPNINAITINKVTGGIPSYIAGAMQANGRIVLLNDAGMTITNTAKINVQALYASTAKDFTMTDAEMKFSNYGSGTIQNMGNITAANGGQIVLFGNKISNNGNLTANKGQVILGSAKSNSLFFNDGKFTYDVSEANTTAVDSYITNTGKITAKSGFVEVETAQLQDLRSGVINLSGVIDATQFDKNSAGSLVDIHSSSDLYSNASINVNSSAGKAGSIQTFAEGMNNFSGTYNAAYGDVLVNGGDITVNGNVTAANTQYNSRNSDIHITDANAKGVLYGANQIGEDKISKAGNYTISNNTNIIIDNQTDGKLVSGGNLLLTTTNGSVKQTDLNDVITAKSLNVQANAAGIQLGAIDVATGDVKLSSGYSNTPAGFGNVEVKNIKGGKIDITGKDITTGAINGSNTTITSAGAVNVATLSAGNLTATSTGNMTVGAIANGSTGSYNLNSGGKITAGIITGNLVAKAGNGGIELGNLTRCTDCNLETTGGIVTGDVSGNISAKAGTTGMQFGSITGKVISLDSQGKVTAGRVSGQDIFMSARNGGNVTTGVISVSNKLPAKLNLQSTNAINTSDIYVNSNTAADVIINAKNDVDLGNFNANIANTLTTTPNSSSVEITSRAGSITLKDLNVNIGTSKSAEASNSVKLLADKDITLGKINLVASNTAKNGKASASLTLGNVNTDNVNITGSSMLVKAQSEGTTDTTKPAVTLEYGQNAVVKSSLNEFNLKAVNGKGLNTGTITKIGSQF